MEYKCEKCEQYLPESDFQDKLSILCNHCQPHLKLSKIVKLDKILKGSSLIFTDLVILYHLHDGDYYVKELGDTMGQTKEGLRLRLKKLANRGLVCCEIEGVHKTGLYSISELGKQFVDAAGEEL